MGLDLSGNGSSIRDHAAVVLSQNIWGGAGPSLSFPSPPVPFHFLPLFLLPPLKSRPP